MLPKLHIFVCTLHRSGKMPSCAQDGVSLFETLKSRALARDPKGIWVTETKCLGWCSKNPGGTLISYPNPDMIHREVLVEALPELVPELFTEVDLPDDD